MSRRESLSGDPADGAARVVGPGVRGVVFDVDGTLYDGRRLRIRMLRELAAYGLRRGDLGLPRRLQTFRRERERLAESEAQGIRSLQYERPARRLGIAPEALRADVERWIDERPLRHLAACRFPGVAELFDRLRATGRRIAVLSDYPAARKLEALGLAADLAVAAEDPGVDRLKPHPAGLLRVLDLLALPPEACLLIGDRDDRDGECARRAGVACLLKSRRRSRDPRRFRAYDELEVSTSARPEGR